MFAAAQIAAAQAAAQAEKKKKQDEPPAPQYQVPVATLMNPYARYGTWSETPMGPYQYGMPQTQTTQTQQTQQMQYAYAGAPGGVTTIEYLPGAVAPYSSLFQGGKILDLQITTGQSASGRDALREAEEQMKQYQQSLQEQVAGAYPTTDLVASGSPAAYPMYAASAPAEEAVATEQMPLIAAATPMPPAEEGLGSKWIWIAVAGVAAYLFTRGGKKEA